MMPAAIWTPSPNYTKKSLPRIISCVIIHSTATEGKESPLNWLTSKESGVSAHWLVDKLGMVYSLVNPWDVAWHAGRSEWLGQERVNNFSLGIELVNKNDGQDPYPFPQLEACADICAHHCRENNIAASNVIGHADIAPGRKFDPMGFPWVQFREMLMTRGLGA